MKELQDRNFEWAECCLNCVHIYPYEEGKTFQCSAHGILMRVPVHVCDDFEMDDEMIGTGEPLELLEYKRTN